jgi:hypothetical protein
LHLSIFARPHEAGLVDSWRADSQSLSVAQSRNYPMCKNAKNRKAARRIFRNPGKIESALQTSRTKEAFLRDIYSIAIARQRVFTQPRPGTDIRGDQRRNHLNR